jgi:hypothetical protein
MDASGLPVKAHLDDVQTERESGPSNTSVARFGQSDQDSLFGGETNVQSDQSQERLESADLLLSYHARDRELDQQIGNEETMDLRRISVDSEISRRTPKTGRSLGLDIGHSDASANERFSSRIKKCSTQPQWIEADPPCPS